MLALYDLGQVAVCPPDAAPDAAGECRCNPGFREDPTTRPLRCVAQPFPLTQSPRGRGGRGGLIVGTLLIVAIVAGIAAAALGAQPGDLGDFAEAL